MLDCKIKSIPYKYFITVTRAIRKMIYFFRFALNIENVRIYLSWIWRLFFHEKQLDGESFVSKLKSHCIYNDLFADSTESFEKLWLETIVRTSTMPFIIITSLGTGKVRLQNGHRSKPQSISFFNDNV